MDHLFLINIKYDEIKATGSPKVNNENNEDERNSPPIKSLFLIKI
tara:strand:- start:248 stop:382 length:135 start_codon:yes stop_codon:yes gene_type:complete